MTKTEQHRDRTARRTRGLAGVFAACLTLGFLPTAVLADGASGAGWDDSHMRSRHRPFVKEVAPPVSGQTRFGELATDTAPAPHGKVPATIERVTQRGWEQGIIRPAPAPAVHGGGAPAGGSDSFGRSGSRAGSQLRAESVSRRR
jgi:hypothetical protein